MIEDVFLVQSETKNLKNLLFVNIHLKLLHIYYISGEKFHICWIFKLFSQQTVSYLRYLVIYFVIQTKIVKIKYVMNTIYVVSKKYFFSEEPVIKTILRWTLQMLEIPWKWNKKIWRIYKYTTTDQLNYLRKILLLSI